MSESANGVAFDKFLLTIDELYIYIHRDTIKKKFYAIDALLITIVAVFIVTLLKMTLIFFCFFVKWITFDFIYMIIKLFRYKCSILLKEICFNINYLKKIFKKIYTYNFYSYESEVYGPIWIIIIPITYITFIIGNLIFCFYESYKSNPSERDGFRKNVFLIIIFYLHLFIEIYISLFYCIKSLKKHIQTTSIIFCFGCINVFWLYGCSFINMERWQFSLLQRIARMIYIIYFLFTYTKSLKIVFQYNMNSKFFLTFD